MSTDLIVRIGFPVRHEFPVLDAAGNPRALPGWSAHAILQARVSDAEPAALPTVRLRPGVAVLEMPGQDSADWVFGVGRYAIVLADPKGRQELLESGRVLVDRR